MYPWGDNRRFNSYAAYFRRTFGHRMQKVAVNAGFTCPNRDGTVGRGGCSFCDNAAFTPSYCTPAKSITRQIDEGIEFHRRRYRTAEGFMVYFQSFSNTYAPLEHLRRLYDEALAHPHVAGIVVGTRPDCVDERKLDYFATLARDRYVAIEYGVESTSDVTLRRINRGHDYAAARRAIALTAERGIHTGAHFILGLPGEPRQMLIDRTAEINALPLTTVKFHQLQIIKGTAMEKEYARKPEDFLRFGMEEYLDFIIDILERLRPDLYIERIAGEVPPRFVNETPWGLVRNFELLRMLDRRMEERNAWQGRLWPGLEALTGSGQTSDE